jgi:hypothetical protein
MTARLCPIASARHTAAVYRREAEARRSYQPDFADALDQWAANADARADALSVPAQPDLFTPQAA